MESVGKPLLVLGIAVAAAGGAALLLSRLGFDRLPGDVVVRRDGFVVYAPIGLMIVLSVLLTIVLDLVLRK